MASGARTGLANVVTAGLFLLSLFLSPLVRAIGGGYQAAPGIVLYPVIAPALVLVGAMMIRSVAHIRWDDVTETVPAFFTIVMMPLTVSISDGIAFGFVSYAFLKVVTGRGASVNWIVYLFAGLFVIRYLI